MMVVVLVGNMMADAAAGGRNITMAAVGGD
jgi:hypothetical protein